MQALKEMWIIAWNDIIDRSEIKKKKEFGYMIFDFEEDNSLI